MPWVRFTGPFDYHVPGKPVTLAFKRGEVRLVVTPCAKLAIERGAAVPIEKEKRDGERGKRGATSI